jgi:Major Facilitator Superfamily
LFFSVPLTEARPKIMAYLLLTVVPFAVVAPLIGPAIDRYRGGHRVVLASVCAGRGVICVAMAGQLNTLLVYPEALGVLALSKVYAVAKTALVPGLIANTDALVDANSRLSRVSALAGAGGAVVGAAVTHATGAPAVLVIAAALFGAAAATATRLPRPHPGVRVPRALEYEEVHAPAPMLAAGAMAVLRAGIGFLTFLLAFALREVGEPAWFFGLALAAGGVGAFAGTYVASWLRRSLHEEQMLALALVVPALFILAAGVQVGRPSVIGAALSLGLGASIGRQAFDSLIQHKAPDATRGRLLARFETGFQLAWAAGALIPVALRPPTWAGLLALASILITGSVAYIIGARTSLRFEAEATPTRQDGWKVHSRPWKPSSCSPPKSTPPAARTVSPSSTPPPPATWRSSVCCTAGLLGTTRANTYLRPTMSTLSRHANNRPRHPQRIRGPGPNATNSTRCAHKRSTPTASSPPRNPTTPSDSRDRSSNRCVPPLNQHEPTATPPLDPRPAAGSTGEATPHRASRLLKPASEPMHSRRTRNEVGPPPAPNVSTEHRRRGHPIAHRSA